MKCPFMASGGERSLGIQPCRSVKLTVVLALRLGRLRAKGGARRPLHGAPPGCCPRRRVSQPKSGRGRTGCEPAGHCVHLHCVPRSGVGREPQGGAGLHSEGHRSFRKPSQSVAMGCFKSHSPWPANTSVECLVASVSQAATLGFTDGGSTGVCVIATLLAGSLRPKCGQGWTLRRPWLPDAVSSGDAGGGGSPVSLCAHLLETPGPGWRPPLRTSLYLNHPCLQTVPAEKLGVRTSTTRSGGHTGL